MFFCVTVRGREEGTIYTGYKSTGKIHNSAQTPITQPISLLRRTSFRTQILVDLFLPGTTSFLMVFQYLTVTHHGFENPMSWGWPDHVHMVWSGTSKIQL